MSNAGAAHPTPSLLSKEAYAEEGGQPELSKQAAFDAPRIVLDDAHKGVEVTVTSFSVYTRWSKWALFIGMALFSYAFSLDTTTTWAYLAWATSAMEDHGLLSTVQVATSIMSAVGKPVLAKIADVGSRGYTFVLASVLHAVGCAIMASAQNIGAIAGGNLLYTVGLSGMGMLQSIVLADITTLQNRAMVSGLLFAPNIINAFVGANLSASVVENSGWRWGYGMFSIIVPASLTPLIVSLLWGEWKARKIIATRNADTEISASPATSFLQKAQGVTEKLDVVGLVLLGASLALFLLPFTLAPKAVGEWRNASMIAMLVVGIVLFPVFVLWEAKCARYPVFPVRFLKNRALLLSSVIGALYFISHFLVQNYLYSFIIVVKPWSLVNQTYFSQTQTVSGTIASVAAGVYMRFSHRYRNMLFLSLVVRLLGIGVMIHTVREHGSDFEFVATQLLQGFGGGVVAVATGVVAQAAVPHADVATSIAFISLVSEIGGALGSAVSGAIWNGLMPGKLRQYLPDVPEEQIELIFGSIVEATADPTLTPGITEAYSDVLVILTSVAVVFTAVATVLAIFLPNYYMGDKQNAVDNVGLDGKPQFNPDVDGPVAPSTVNEKA